MKQDIKFNIRALVAILRHNGFKVWVDFRKHNKSSLSGVYGELCDKVRKEYTPETFKLEDIQREWLKTMKVFHKTQGCSSTGRVSDFDSDG